MSKYLVHCAGDEIVGKIRLHNEQTKANGPVFERQTITDMRYIYIYIYIYYSFHKILANDQPEKLHTGGSLF